MRGTQQGVLVDVGERDDLGSNCTILKVLSKQSIEEWRFFAEKLNVGIKGRFSFPTLKRTIPPLSTLYQSMV